MYRSLVLLILVASSARAADWPQFLGPTRDGQSTETKLNWAWGKNGPPVVWKADVGSGFAGPVVAKGMVYLFHRIGDDEVLSAFASDTGKEVWKYTAPARGTEGPQAAPLVANGTVFAVGYGGKLHAVNAKTGEKVWVRDLKKDYSPPEGYFGVGAGLLHVNGKLLMNVGAKGAGIVAFDEATGKEVWKATDDPPSYSTPTVVELGGKPHGVFFTRTGLVVVNANTGEVTHNRRHRSRIDASVNASTPLMRGEEVFLTAQYGTGAVLLKLKGPQGDEVWANDTSLSCQYHTPVRVGEYLYGIHGRQDTGLAHLVCGEWKTGAVQWKQERFGVAHLLAVDGGVLALTEDGNLVRFDASEKGYTERARAAVLEGLTRAGPAIADGRLYLRNDKTLIAVSLK
jgi:outer membrane protein assembly factor BamB